MRPISCKCSQIHKSTTRISKPTYLPLFLREALLLEFNSNSLKNTAVPMKNRCITSAVVQYALRTIRGHEETFCLRFRNINCPKDRTTSHSKIPSSHRAGMPLTISLPSDSDIVRLRNCVARPIRRRQPPANHCPRRSMFLSCRNPLHSPSRATAHTCPSRARSSAGCCNSQASLPQHGLPGNNCTITPQTDHSFREHHKGNNN